MAKAHPISEDLKQIIIDVTGQTPMWIFNDKRKYCIRRYKYSGINDVSKKKIRKIRKRIGKKYPDYQFVVQNHVDTLPFQSWTRGLTVKVFE